MRSEVVVLACVGLFASVKALPNGGMHHYAAPMLLRMPGDGRPSVASNGGYRRLGADNMGSIGARDHGRLSLRGGSGNMSPVKIDWTSVVGNLFGGLALFLYGMERLGVGLKNAFGERLRGILLMLSYNRFVGFTTGLVACGITNSLSLISVLLVEFVSSDLIPFNNCMGILLGACVGSTLISFLVVLKVTKWGLAMVALGYLLNTSSKVYQTKQIGLATFGCGIIFFSMDLMSSAFGFLRSHDGFIDILTKMDNPLLGILVSTAVTGLIQSSGATMSILLSLAGQGMLTIPSACGLMLGANIGTCVTGMLASIGQPVDGVRLAVALLLFRVLGVAAVYPFLRIFMNVVCKLCKIQSMQNASAKEVTLFLAWSHTTFNVILSLGGLPFTVQWADFIRFLIPSEDENKSSKDRAKNGSKSKTSSNVCRSPSSGLSLCSKCSAS